LGAAIVVRGGPAIGVDRYHGQPLAVTTTHAADSATHLYRLVTRAG
jgi:hypothetical protein